MNGCVDTNKKMSCGGNCILMDLSLAWLHEAISMHSATLRAKKGDEIRSSLPSMTGMCMMKKIRYTRSRLRWKMEVAIVLGLRCCDLCYGDRIVSVVFEVQSLRRVRKAVRARRFGSP